MKRPFSGGGGGIRTPVRRWRPLGFSERSPCFRFQGGPPTGRVSSPTAFLKFPDSGRKAKPESVGWISHALFRSPANFGEDGRLSIKRQQQQVRWHLFFVPPFLRGGGDLGSLPRGLHPRRTRSPPGLSIHLYYTTFIIPLFRLFQMSEGSGYVV